MSSLKFGTSGLRGLVEDLVGRSSYSYSLAFLRYLRSVGVAGDTVLIGRDLRASSPAIADRVAGAARAAGFKPLDCGAVPTPALALESLARGAPAVMVTGSHIPDDRNGLKFYRPDGEITKHDEAGILAAFAAVEHEAIAEDVAPEPPAATDTLDRYRRRYVDFFGAGALRGLTVGVYQHSTVARDLLVELLEALGAQAAPLGRSDRFVPVDTEAHRPEDVGRIADWAADGGFDAIVSADGDADRPLVADEGGGILRGDVLGLLAARALGLETIVTPVTSGAATERSGIATKVVRTRVGSPFVIEAMRARVAAGDRAVGGFEANGGFLLASPVTREGRTLDALPTRDAVLPILALLADCRARGAGIGEAVRALDAGHAASHRLAEIASERSAPFLEKLAIDGGYRDSFFAPFGTVGSIDELDGVKVRLASGETIHFRASGNAPELRCYVEASSRERAAELLERSLARAGAAMG